jgi:ribosomal protein S18 acetylase RimI-like enzyme
LLIEVFVGEGFSSSDDGRAALEGDVLAERGTAWIATSVDAARPIGTVFLVEPDNPFRQIAVAAELELHLLAVAPSHRRSGVADALVRVCVSAARERGAARLVLSTQPTMGAAHRLYEKHGFIRNPARDWARPGRSYWAYLLELGEVATQP